jgi:hypothetical protein
LQNQKNEKKSAESAHVLFAFPIRLLEPIAKLDREREREEMKKERTKEYTGVKVHSFTFLPLSPPLSSNFVNSFKKYGERNVGLRSERGREHTFNSTSHHHHHHHPYT